MHYEYAHISWHQPTKQPSNQPNETKLTNKRTDGETTAKKEFKPRLQFIEVLKQAIFAILQKLIGHRSLEASVRCSQVFQVHSRNLSFNCTSDTYRLQGISAIKGSIPRSITPAPSKIHSTTLPLATIAAAAAGAVAAAVATSTWLVLVRESVIKYVHIYEFCIAALDICSVCTLVSQYARHPFEH
uniref:Uncharacterized protein n=1 Tax=Glossina palpalis gambiensis TaxID=67801 RepID=A0A1B0B7I3_9MUSC